MTTAAMFLVLFGYSPTYSRDVTARTPNGDVVMVYRNARGARHRDCAADHPERFTTSERAVAIVAKGGL